MKKKIFFIGTLIFAAFIMMACSNLLGDNNRKESAIELSLPYGKAPASRAAEDSKDAKEVYSFSVIFKHESGTEVEMQAKSGENLTYKNAPTGKPIGAIHLLYHSKVSKCFFNHFLFISRHLRLTTIL